MILSVHQTQEHGYKLIPEGLPERPTNFVGPYCPKCIIKWPRCLCITESDWEDNVTQQMPMPRTSSPYPDDSDKRLEKLETETEDELDQIDNRTRPANDKRLPKPRHRPTFRQSPPNWLTNDYPTPQTSPEYIMMVASPQQTKQPTNAVRGILAKRRKMPHGWPKCLGRTPPKMVLRNNDLYNTEKIENHHYKEPQEMDSRVFFNIQGNMQNNKQSNMQREEEINENYESVEERETAI